MSNVVAQLSKTPVIQPGTSDRMNKPWVDFFHGLGQQSGMAGVSSVNSLTGALEITGTNIAVAAAGQNIQLTAEGAEPGGDPNQIEWNSAGSFGGVAGSDVSGGKFNISQTAGINLKDNSQGGMSIVENYQGASLLVDLSTQAGNTGSGTIQTLSEWGTAINDFGVTLPIVAVDQGAKTFSVAGDITKNVFWKVVVFINGIVVRGSTGNNGLYPVSTVSYVAPNTVVTITSSIPDSTADGNIQVADQGASIYENAIGEVIVGHGGTGNVRVEHNGIGDVRVDNSGTGNVLINCDNDAIYFTSKGGLQFPLKTFATLPGTPTDGRLVSVSDSNVSVQGSVISGSGAFHVLAYFDGTNWVVAASGNVSSGPSFADAEVPSGSGTAFTLAHSPSPAASLQLFRNGILQTAGIGNDYTVSGSSLTLALALGGSDTLICWYRY